MAQASWLSTSGGNWTTASDWSIGGVSGVPGAGDDAVIGVAGNYSVSITTSITVAAIAISDTGATVAIVDPGGTVAVGGDVTNAGGFAVDGDSFTGEGGSSVTIAGTLTNCGNLTFGPRTGGLGAPTRITAAALVNTGNLYLTGNTSSTSTNAATLDIGSAAGFGTLGVLTGNVCLNGTADLEFASGEISTIAAGANLQLYGSSLLSDASDTTHNSALTGLSEIDGNFYFAYGETLAIANNVTVAGSWGIDGDSFTSEGGSSVTIAGTLDNAGNLAIGVRTGGLAAPTHVTAEALVNTGNLYLTGNFNGAPTNTATFDIGSAAGFGTLGVLTGNVYLNGPADLEFASGEISTIAAGANFQLYGSSLLSDASDTTHNSALTDLSQIDGNFYFAYGETLAIANNVTVTGSWGIDGDSFTSEGGSGVTIAGTLDNAGNLTIGVRTGGLAAPTRVNTAALVNTGNLYLTGNFNGAPTNTATFDIGSAAGFGTLGVLTGNVYLNGPADLEFASGEISTIAAGANLQLFGASLLSDASDTTHNSALTGLSEIDGNFDFAYGETLAIANNVTVTGGWGIDGDSFTSEGSSSVTVAGTLDNAGNLTVGPRTGGLAAPTRVTTAALVNTGNLYLTGNTGGTLADTATLDIGSAAGFGTLGVLSGNVYLNGVADLEFASGEITTIAAGANLQLFGSSLLSDASDTTHNSALTGLSQIDGNFDFAYGETLAIANTVTITGSWGVDGDSFTSEGGSSVTIAGTVDNARNLTVGPRTGGLVAPTRVTAAALVNTGNLYLTGNTGGTLADTATLDIGSAAGFGTLGVLTGNVYLNGVADLEFASGEISTIAAGANLQLFGSSLLSDASDTTHNSALTGLSQIDGSFDFAYGETLAFANNVTITGSWGVDGDSFTSEGGSNVTIAGTLDNAGNLTIGPATGDLAAPTRVTAAALVNTGNIRLTGNFNGAPTNTATFDIGSAAGFGTLGVLTGNVYLNGPADLEFASGEISTIAAGANLQLFGASLISNASDTAHNSALSGLSQIAGNFDFAYGETLAIANNVTVTGNWGIDGDSFTSEGGGSVTIAGTLDNAGNLTVGPRTGGLASPATIKAQGLANTGNISLTGNGTIAATATIDGTASNANELVINSSATLVVSDAYTQQAGDIYVGGMLQAATATVSGGTLRGVGAIDGAVQDTGATIYGGSSPTSPGTLAISGSLTIAAGATLTETIAGTAAGQASEITVQGPVSLQGGTLDLNVLNGASLAAGETFDVLSFTPGDLTGTFASLLFGGTLDPGTGSSTLGNGLYVTPIYDNTDGLVKLAITATPYNPPTVTAPASDLLNAGSATAIGGISVVAHQPGTISVQVTDTYGLLAATASGSATVTGDHSTALTLAGDAADVNAELASLTDTPQGATLSDTVVVTATDAALQTNSGTIAISINQPPTLSLPPFALEAPGTAEPISNLSVADPDAVSAGETLTVVLTDTAGLLSATASGAGTVAGADTTQLTLTGSLPDLNAELHSLTFNGSSNDTLAITVDDGRGLTASGTLTVEVSAPPALSAPSGSVTEFNSAAAAFSGVSLTAPANAPPDFVTTVTVQSTLGLLSATPAGGVTATGGGTTQLTLTGTISALNTTLQSLTYSGPSSGASDTITISTPSGTATPVTRTVTVNLTPPAPPVLTLPTAAADPGVLTPVDGLSVADATGEPANTPLTVTLSDAAGVLRLQYLATGATVSGAGTTTLTLTGTAAQIDGDLALLSFQDSSAGSPGSALDTIHVSATLGGATSNGNFIVFEPPASSISNKLETAPAILNYTGALPPDATSTEGGQIRATGDLITVYLSLPKSGAVQYALGAQNNDAVPINVTYYVQTNPGAIGFSTIDDGGAPIEGQAALSLSYILTAVDQNPQPGDTITYVIKSSDNNSSVLPDDRVTVKFGKPGGSQSITPFPSTHTTDGKGPTPYIITPNGFSFPKSVIPHSQGGSLETHLHELSPSVYPPPPGPTGSDGGDVHLTTFDGLLYNFQAAGEFVLAKSTAAGDTFQVQIRTQPWSNGSFASVTTEIGAAIGTHRVTFDLDRTDTVWVDGAPVNLTPGGAPIDLGDGTLQQLTATSWTMRWDSGEILTVTDSGTFLNAQVTLTPNAQPGSVEGLLGADRNNPAHEFTLPDGTVLSQPLSYADLYTTWADAWRVTQATSLLDYGPGQTTGSFTDLSYPSDAEPISLFPAALVAQAESLVAAAGITDPALAQAAVEDYLLTGDTSFISADAQLGAPSAIAAEPSSPNAPGGVGAAAVSPVVVEAASGATPVDFSVYRIGNDSAAQVVDYQVASGAAGELAASDFTGDVLPSGQVTIAAGSTVATFTIDIASQLGSTPAATLAVGIDTGSSGTPVIAATANVAVVNNQPVPGIAALPEFVNQGEAGTLTRIGNNFTLDLGTFDLDSILPTIKVALANDGSIGADLLGGIFGVSKPDGLGVVSGTGPVVNLGADGLIPLTFALNTATEGSFSQRIDFNANESNASGYQASLGTYSLTVFATVSAPPSGTITPTSINFGRVHQGSTVAQAVTIANTSADTVVVNGTVAGAATISSNSVTLAPGTTSASSLDVGLATSNDGVQGGVAVLPLATAGNIGAVANLLLTPVSVGGSGSFINSASLLANGVVAPDGTADSDATAVSWTDPATSFTYNLGSIEAISGALASVDATGTYVVSTSTDDVTFTPLFTITPASGAGTGLETLTNLTGSPFYDPAIAFTPADAQYVRLQAMGGDGTFAASELDLFAAAPTVAVSGTVFAEAVPAVISPSPLILHVGSPGTLTLTSANDAPTDSFGENLIASLAAVSGGFTIDAAGPTGEITAGGSDTTSLRLGFSTTQAGVISGTATVDLTSDGGTGPGSIDGLGTTALAPTTVPVSVTVQNYASAAFEVVSGAGTGAAISGSGTSETLNLGTIALGSGPLTIGLSALNSATGPADLLSGSFQATGSSAFATSGFGAFSGLAAGQADIVPTITLDTGTTGVETETITLSSTGSNASGYSAALPTTTLQVTATIEPLPSPAITAPGTQTVFVGMPAMLGPISVADANAGNGSLTVVVTDTAGTLTAAASGAGTVSGIGSHRLTLTGDLTDLDTELTSLTYTAAAIGTDTVTVDVTDAHDSSAVQSIDVTTDVVPPTPPVLNAPFGALLIPGQPSGIGGISISDPSAEASGQQISLTLTSQGFATGDITVTGGPGGTVIGNGTTLVTITGTVPQVNSYLADGVTENILQDAYAKAEAAAKEAGETYGKAWALFFGLATGALAEGLAGAGTEFGKFLEDQAAEKSGNPTPENLGGDLLEVNAGLYSFAANVLNDVAALAAGATTLPPPAGEGGGDAHIVTYSDQVYQLDGAGDYLLTGSKSPSDSFTVEVRLTPINGSSSASVISQVAAEVGTDTVTIGVGRVSVVMIDGKAVSLTSGMPVSLSGGQIEELSANTYQVTWNTGEILTVNDYGSFLNVKAGLGSNDTPGSLIGLMGPDNGQANDFTLQNGSVASVTSTADLYGFADTYLVPPSLSLLDGTVAPNLSFPAVPLTLADFSPAQVAQATQAVSAAGITDPGALAAAELDYLLSGGNPSFIAADQSLFQGVTTTEAPITPPPAVAALGVLPDAATVNVNQTGETAVTFDVELTQARTLDSTVNFAVIAPDTADLGAAAFGGTLPSGSTTITAGQTSGQFTIEVPEGALGSLTSADVAVAISSADGVPVYASTASATVTTPQPGAPPVPTLTYMTDFGTFIDDGNNSYTLDLGPVQYGQPLPTLQFGLENAAAGPADLLSGTFSVAPVEGFTVSGGTLPAALAAGQAYDGLTATINTIKFGDNTETITFDPVDTNGTGYSASMAPVTLTITDTLELPSVTYSQAWGDVHIVTYNGLTYNFQAVGDYTLAESRIPNDTFDIEMELEPYYTGASVTTIHQVAITLGTDTATFDWNRTGTGSDDPVWIDHAGVTFTLGQTLTLAGGTITEVSPDVFKVDWNTGETMTVTNGGAYMNIVDGVPPGDLSGGVAGLQGEGEGAANDLQLSDGTVLQQPVSTSELYGEYLQSWEAPSTNFDGPAPPYTGPVDPLTLADLPADVVAQAAAVVAAAGITNPAIAQAAELDYLATGDQSFIVSAAAAQQQAKTITTTVNQVTANTQVAPAIGVMANAPRVTEASSGATTVTFTAYLTSDQSTSTDVHYTVVDAGAGFLGASAFGGTLPSGDVTIAAGTESTTFQVAVPATALGSLPNENLQVQVSSGPGNATPLPIFAPTAQTEIDNDQPVPGNPAIPELSELTGGGTLTFNASTNTYTLDLGTLLQGSQQSAIELALDNMATPPADSLDGSFTAPLGSGFGVTGASLPAPLAAGDSYTGLQFTVNTAALGPNTMTLDFNPTDINNSGYSKSLGPITLDVVDTIALPAAAAINTPTTILFPNVRVGTTESQPVSVTNTATAPAADVDVTPYANGDATATGSVSLLAPGVTDASHVSAGLDTGTAGARSGVVDLDIQSDTGNGNGVPILPFTPVDVFGSVYRPAAPSIAGVDLTVHVGQPGTVALDIANTATADGFSENLIASLASVTSGLGIVSAGPTGEIAPGTTNDPSLLLSFPATQAGTLSGTATVDLTSDGGTGTGSIDGLGTMALAPDNVPVTITVDNYAAPAFQNLSGSGTFQQNGTTASLNLGTIAEGSGPFAINLGVINSAAGPADLLSGSLAVVGSSAFTNSGTAAFSGLAAGQADIAPMVTLATDASGTFAETITLMPTGSNASGFSGVLANDTLTVTGTVAALNFIPAIASVSPASPINFGNVHVGAAADQTLDISNTATAGAASLDGSVGSETGDATAIGSFASLAPGAPASTAISVGIDTASAGAKSGTVSLGFVSDDGSGGSAALPSHTIALTGTVYREATASLLPISETVHVGDPGTAAISVINTDPNDGFSESLIAALLSTSSDMSIGSGGPTGDIVAGGSNDTALAIGFSTATAGTITGTATIGLTSDGGTGVGSVDGLGQTALPDQTVPVSVTVDNYAKAELTSDGNLTPTGINAYTLDLGTTTQGSAALTADLSVLNAAAGPSDWLSGTLAANGSGAFTTSGFGPFGTIGAGGSLDAGSVSLATSQTGDFSETITLTPLDSNASGFSQTLDPQTVTVVGTIVAAGTAKGDVHMVTYDGLHYDFQADGSYVLTRSTVPGDSFQIQIATAPDAADNAVSFTTLEAAQIGNDVVTFAIGRPATVWIDGTPDTALNPADPVQSLEGGTLRQLSADNFQLAWTTGQMLTVTDDGANLDTSVTLGAGGHPGKVQGLLGTASGAPVNDFQLPDGTVLAQPLSGEELYGTFANAWSVTAADSLLGDAAGTSGVDPTIAPASLGTLAGGAMQFYAGSTGAAGVVQASAPGQVLSPGAGVSMLSDADGFGATFQGTLAEFAKTLLADVSAKDLIDVVDLSNAGITTSFAGSDTAGVLYLSDGAQSGELYLAGQLAGAAFRTESDGHGGSLISLG